MYKRELIKKYNFLAKHYAPDFSGADFSTVIDNFLYGTIDELGRENNTIWVATLISVCEKNNYLIKKMLNILGPNYSGVVLVFLETYKDMFATVEYVEIIENFKQLSSAYNQRLYKQNKPKPERCYSSDEEFVEYTLKHLFDSEEDFWTRYSSKILRDFPREMLIDAPTIEIFDFMVDELLNKKIIYDINYILTGEFFQRLFCTECDDFLVEFAHHSKYKKHLSYKPARKALMSTDMLKLYEDFPLALHKLIKALPIKIINEYLATYQIDDGKPEFLGISGLLGKCLKPDIEKYSFMDIAFLKSDRVLVQKIIGAGYSIKAKELQNFMLSKDFALFEFLLGARPDLAHFYSNEFDDAACSMLSYLCKHTEVPHFAKKLELLQLRGAYDGIICFDDPPVVIPSMTNIDFEDGDSKEDIDSTILGESSLN